MLDYQEIMQMPDRSDRLRALLVCGDEELRAGHESEALRAYREVMVRISWWNKETI